MHICNFRHLRMKYRGWVFLFFFNFSAFSQDRLILSKEQAEAIFLKENMSLLIGHLDIAQSEAEALQAKLWPNPVFTFDQVNLWATPAQTGGQVQIPSIGGLWPNQQFGFNIEQLILTAGKRKKLMALEQVNIEMSKQYFEDLLRGLKFELRNLLTSMQYLQLCSELYSVQYETLKLLSKSYNRQIEIGGASQAEFVRLKALEFELAQKWNNVQFERNEVEKELKILLRIPSNRSLEISQEGYRMDVSMWKKLSLNELINLAKLHSPDYKLALLEEDYYAKLYVYEKAQRFPDLSLNMGYDRGGNAMLDFVGFGVKFDLPVFHRNQGRLKSAQIGIEKSALQERQSLLKIEQEVGLAYQNLMLSIAFMEDKDPGYEGMLDTLLERYTENFKSRNISLLEYSDFMRTYIENKKIILESIKMVQQKAEELNFSAGIDLIK